MVTSRDVAKVAGVSQATVSRAMSPTAKISPHTRDRVYAAMEALGYIPHAAATSMKTRRTNTVGVVVADLTNPFYPEVLDELTRELALAGIRVIIWNAGGGPQSDALKAIRERAVDGVVFTTVTEESAELRAAVERKSPIVLINRSVTGVDCDQVVGSNRDGGRLVADYLVEHGRTDVVFVGGPANASTARERSDGFLGRMAELGHPVPSAWRWQTDFTHNAAMRVVGDALSAPARPDAIFCTNDYTAFGALDALRARGLSVPGHCWVVGYDDVDMASWPSFDLTTIRQPSREMARIGARLLLTRIESPDRPSERREFPCELIARGTTGTALRRA